MDDAWRFDHAAVLKQGPKRLAEIAHLREIRNAPLMNPLQQLRGTKGLFTPLRTKDLEGLVIKTQQVDFFGRLSAFWSRAHSA